MEIKLAVLCVIGLCNSFLSSSPYVDALVNSTMAFYDGHEKSHSLSFQLEENNNK